MEQKQPNSEVNTELLTDAGTDTARDTNKAYEQFMPTIASLKELDLMGIEPLLPPTYKKRLYVGK
ncbi:hypothetical protein QFZ81_004903 [Paenibacillus sp. V4I9]|uniref:hypothetical protein n=1 Tax=Paenibacillus sp. V4I9 TaxID=3042308 RepID=UPI00278A551B|nr:hypothetical protein [Paenibacillus sp. V4I9]MDQ0889815.1 hypothetical protein [Paenibacillus sp. V4I9]